VSGNVVRNVEGSAIRVSNTAVYGLNVSNNLIHEALTAGVAGNATIGVNLDAGEGFVFSGNRLGSTSYKGISISGAATATLDAVTFTGNSVSFSGGASPEEGLAVFWPNRLAALTLSGNVVQGAAVGMCIEGGLPTSVAGPLPSLVRGVAITANSVSASNGGVRVSNTTTDSGVGTASLEDVQVSGNTLTADSATLAMVYGVQVDTIFGTLEKVTVTGNTIDMGSSSTGDGVLIDANDAAPSQVSVSDNSTLNGDHGVYVLGNGTATFSGITVCRNRVSSLDTDGILLSGMTALRSVTVDGNTVEDTGARGVSIFSSDIQQDSRNVSVSGNSVNSTEGAGIRVQLYTSAASPTMHNLSVCHNKVSNWNDGTAAAVLTSAIRIALCNDVLKPHPLKNLNVSHNLCENVDAANDWVQGFDFSLDEETRQVVFAHNQVLLGNQTNAGAMHWTFINTGGPVPKDFTFTGNQFCDTNSVAPSFTAGLPGDFATFYGNIGSALNFWTTFATNWATYVPNGAISTHNIDDGT
jgi:hypothetical protein